MDEYHPGSHCQKTILGTRAKAVRDDKEETFFGRHCTVRGQQRSKDKLEKSVVRKGIRAESQRARQSDTEHHNGNNKDILESTPPDKTAWSREAKTQPGEIPQSNQIQRAIHVRPFIRPTTLSRMMVGKGRSRDRQAKRRKRDEMRIGAHMT